MSDIPVNPSSTGSLPPFPQNNADTDAGLLAALQAAANTSANQDMHAAVEAVASASGGGQGTDAFHDGSFDGHNGAVGGAQGNDATDFTGAAAADMDMDMSAGLGTDEVAGGSGSGGDGGGVVGMSPRVTRGGRPNKVGKVWACSSCGRHFTRRFNCTTHERTHLDARDRAQYPCILCPRAFTRRHDLERHINSVHPGHVLEKSVEEDANSPIGGKRRSIPGGEHNRSGPQQVKIRRLSNGELVEPQPAVQQQRQMQLEQRQELSQQHHQQLQQQRQLQQDQQGTVQAVTVPVPDPLNQTQAQIGDLQVTIDSTLMGAGTSLSNGTSVVDPQIAAVHNGTVEIPGRLDGPIERVENVAEANKDNEPVFRFGKRWACGNCGRLFARRNNCKAHEATHRDIREHPCETCNRSFSRRHDLERHITAVHPGVEVNRKVSEDGGKFAGVRVGGVRKKKGDDYELEDSEEGDGEGYRPEENEEEDSIDVDEAFPNSASRAPHRAHLARASRRPHDPNNAADSPAASAAMGLGDNSANGRGYAYDDYPESNLRAGRESNVRGAEGTGTGEGDGGDGTDGTGAAAQHDDDPLAVLQASGLPPEQARALHALLNSGSNVSIGAGSGVTSGVIGGGGGGSDSNIDPSLQNMGNSGSVGDDSAGALSFDFEAFTGIPGLQYSGGGDK